MQLKDSKVLVLAEHDNHVLKQATLNTLKAATQLSEDITVLILGYECSTVAKEVANLEGVKQILLSEAPYYQWPLAEEMAEGIISIVNNPSNNFEYILAPATTFGKNILPRVAAMLGLGQISDVIRIESKDTFVRPIYAGNALVTLQSLDPIKIMTIRPTAFEAIHHKTHHHAPKTENHALKTEHQDPIESITPPPPLNKSKYISHAANVSSRPELVAAKIIISGGRGLQSRENFKILEDLADKLGAAVGASRAAVDAGYVPNDYQIGQTGKVVAPDLYIAVGISGAIQHLSGMKDSKVIVAINKDPDAPIFQLADYGLVGDLFQILPELSQEITIRKSAKIG